MPLERVHESESCNMAQYRYNVVVGCDKNITMLLQSPCLDSCQKQDEQKSQSTGLGTSTLYKTGSKTLNYGFSLP